jgi:hypothetical protein
MGEVIDFGEAKAVFRAERTARVGWLWLIVLYAAWRATR